MLCIAGHTVNDYGDITIADNDICDNDVYPASNSVTIKNPRFVGQLSKQVGVRELRVRVYACLSVGLSANFI